MGLRGPAGQRVRERSRQVTEDRVVDMDVVQHVLTGVLHGDLVGDAATHRTGGGAGLQHVETGDQDVARLLERHRLLPDVDLAATDDIAAVEVGVDVARHVGLERVAPQVRHETNDQLLAPVEAGHANRRGHVLAGRGRARFTLDRDGLVAVQVLVARVGRVERRTDEVVDPDHRPGGRRAVPREVEVDIAVARAGVNRHGGEVHDLVAAGEVLAFEGLLDAVRPDRAVAVGTADAGGVVVECGRPR